MTLTLRARLTSPRQRTETYREEPVIAAAVAAALSQLPAGAQAASPNDLAQIREQLQGLMQRVDKLEQENQSLKSENADLKAQGEDLKAQRRLSEERDARPAQGERA